MTIYLATPIEMVEDGQSTRYGRGTEFHLLAVSNYKQSVLFIT